MSAIDAYDELRPRHIKVTGRIPMFGYERCEDHGCVVGLDGVASSCGRTACPTCGSGGANLTRVPSFLGDLSTPAHITCSCGHSWVAPATPFRAPIGFSVAHTERLEQAS